MSIGANSVSMGQRVKREAGSALLFALIALVAMTIAAIALTRSVDTATLVAGNLAFRQAATSSGDQGVEAAIAAMNAWQTASAGKVVTSDLTHNFNVSKPGSGYYSFLDPALDLSSNATWTDARSSAVRDCGYGDATCTYRYIIQRMCRTENALPTTENCLFSGRSQTGNDQKIGQVSCEGAGCASTGLATQYRVTVRITGSKNAVSYIQAILN